MADRKSKSSRAALKGWRTRRAKAQARSQAAKKGWARRKATAALQKKAATGKKISASLKQYHQTGKTKKERTALDILKNQVVLFQAPPGEEIPAFQLKDQVEDSKGLNQTLTHNLDKLAPGALVSAEFSVATFAPDGTKTEKTSEVIVTVTDPQDPAQFWRDFYASVREDLEHELDADGDGKSDDNVSITCTSLVG